METNVSIAAIKPHLLVCEWTGYRHTQARPPLWVQMVRPQPCSGIREDGCPDVLLVEGQHWPLPLQLSGSYPAVSHRLLRSSTEKMSIVKSMYLCVCVCMCAGLSLSPVPCFPGLFPKPCSPDLWRVPEPIPGQNPRKDGM